MRERSDIGRFVALAGPYWTSRGGWSAAALTLALVILTIGQVGLMIWTNLWNQRLFDALEQGSIPRLLQQVVVFVAILIATMGVTSLHLVLKRWLQFHWRQWLTARFLELWMAESHHYLLQNIPAPLDNPDGRIAEDIRNATEAAIDLAHSLLYCSLLLISFIGILWTISGPAILKLGPMTITIPGHMVWLAIGFSGIGAGLAVLIGRPLTRATNLRQAVEADFRFGLARARDNALPIAVMHGEPGERRHFLRLLDAIRSVWTEQSKGIARIMLFTSGYGLLVTAFPILVSAPRYISGAISLGVLMQTAQAFQQVSGALSWPVDNTARWAEWRASVDRVLALSGALDRLASHISDGGTGRVAMKRMPASDLEFCQVAIANPDGEPAAAEFSAVIHAGEHVYITGDPSAALKLFKLIAGLWPWGRGEVRMPDSARFFFVTQHPYLPLGTLRSALSYPSRHEVCETAVYEDALRRVGLERLIKRLDNVESWGEVLSGGEQQRLGIARLLLHRPRWIFLQQATDALDQAGATEMMELVGREFADATILTIGFRAFLESFHNRKLLLESAAR